MDALPRADDPAFPAKLPRQDTRGEEAADFAFFGGLTLRDWFATHAPTEIPNWFRFEYAVPAPPLMRRHLEPMPLREELDGYFNNSIGEQRLTPEAKKWIERDRAASDAHCQWQLSRKAASFIAWRWHYADLMLRARGGE